MGDPVALLRQLEDLATDIEELGDDTVRDQPATHYRMLLDYAAALDDIDDEESREMIGRHMAAMGLTESAAEVWVDESDRVVRFTQEIDLGTADPAAMLELLDEQFDDFDGSEGAAAHRAAPIDGVQALTMEFHDFGADLDLRLPDEGDVIDASELDFGF